MTTRARIKLPQCDFLNPFLYTEREFAALRAMLGDNLPVPVAFVRSELERKANTYLLNVDIKNRLGRGPTAKETKRQYKNDSSVLVKAATVVESNLCKILSQYYVSLAIQKRLDQIADDLRTLAGFYDRVTIAKRPRQGNNVDTLRNDVYFEGLLDFWQQDLRRPIAAGYNPGVGPDSDVVLFTAACSRPVIGNDKASLDSVRWYVRNYLENSRALAV